jgi:hypothetical protein
MVNFFSPDNNNNANYNKIKLVDIESNERTERVFPSLRLISTRRTVSPQAQSTPHPVLIHL